MRLRAILLLAIATAGCARATISQESQAVPATSARPSQITIYPFAVDPDDVKLNSGILARAYRSMSGENGNAEQLKIAKDTAHNICVKVAADLTTKGYMATCQNRGIAPSGTNVMVVDGEFTDINEGNKLRRMVVGLGAGASVLDANVYMNQQTEQGLRQVLNFSTHADSGKMPGAAVMGPAGVAAGGSTAAVLGTNAAMGVGKNYTSATGFLADKTATQIVEQVTQYYAKQGWAQ
jgi:hypothetical protein